MLLFVGLGNPGSKYEGHRHNVGFMAVDEIVRRHNFSPERSRFQSLSHEGNLSGEKILVLKPQTFMNESGRAISEAVRFYKLTPADVFVFYDELDLAFGKVKVKTGGGTAGHNGIRSTAAHIGPDFHRIRIGISHPGDKSRVTGHVLGDFAKAEQPELEKMLSTIAAEASWLAKREYPRFMSQIALELSPQRPNNQKSSKAESKDVPAAKLGQSAQNEQKKKPEGPMADALRALKNGDK